MSDAMVGLATGKKQKREQDILTPQVVVDFVRALWCGDIELDPCASRDERAVVDAVAEYRGAPTHMDGLTSPWMDCTYVNPPYKDLKLWLAKAVSEAEGCGLGFPRIAMLAPTRGHRDWWHAARDTCSVVIELRPISFIGYVDKKGRPTSFPAPLSLLLWNLAAADAVAAAVKSSGLRVAKIAYLR